MLYLYLPMHILGPSPNGMNVHGLMEASFSLEKIAGLNFSGSGKNFGSLCKDQSGISMLSPTSIRCPSGIIKGFSQTLFNTVNVGYLRMVSGKNKWQTVTYHYIIVRHT